FAKTFAKAWYKLTHRDMGPIERGLGAEAPTKPEIWQDPIPPVDHELVDAADITSLKERLLASGLTVTQLVLTAWASAATFRVSDRRGGANGARLRLAPQNEWEVNNPGDLTDALAVLEGIRDEFNAAQTGDKAISIADIIVLGGVAAVEKAAKDGGHDITVPFTPGRTDATQEMTDVESFEVLEPRADGFRNHYWDGLVRTPAELLVDKAQLMTLTAPEMTVLVGGMRVLGANADGSSNGVLTDRVGHLTNDYFVNLLDMGTTWEATSKNSYVGMDRNTGEKKWDGTSIDLLFGSNSVLRSLSEVYASKDGETKFVEDFVAAWTKVMELDRFDLHR
ncbi:MAG: peroxidase family protein, partial [Pseudomonadota bacterium]